MISFLLFYSNFHPSKVSKLQFCHQNIIKLKLRRNTEWEIEGKKKRKKKWKRERKWKGRSDGRRRSPIWRRWRRISTLCRNYSSRKPFTSTTKPSPKPHSAPNKPARSRSFFFCAYFDFPYVDGGFENFCKFSEGFNWLKCTVC